MPWFSHSPDRRRFPRFKADILARANVVHEDQILYLGTRCNSISEGGVDAPGLQSLALGDLVTLWLYLPAVSTQPVCEFLSLSYDQRNLIKHYCHLRPKEKHRRPR